ncbi:MAG: HAD family hydrolase [Clostridia bacterium]|nr:HAD family hydrolase [Clostridia bacterium]
MPIKAVLFDKDGTLLDFDALWVPVAERAFRSVLSAYGVRETLLKELLSAIGVSGGKTAVEGLLCGGTYGQIGEAAHAVLAKVNPALKVEEVTERTVRAFHEYMESVPPTPSCKNLRGVLCALKNRGLKLAVVTSDDAVCTQKCLQGLGIEDVFDRVFTDDGVHPPKPDPYYLSAFCALEGLSPAEVAMVGDTPTDMLFARNGGARGIALAKTAENAAVLSRYTSEVLPDPSYLLEALV